MKMKNKLLCLLLSVVCVVFLFPLAVSADTGPKPSVHVTFENLGAELCYGTLLSQTDSTGPFSVWDGDENHIYNVYNLDDEIWRAFVEYEDTDGFYYLQTGWKVSETSEIAWTYYPPNSFKILLYYPETDTFIVSGIYEKYAFDSYYTVDMNGVNIDTVVRLEAHRSYDYSLEILSLIARIVLTILLEIGIAFLFGFRARKQLLLIAGVNIVTQIVLNVLLNAINYSSGQQAFWNNYILFELVVFAIEAILYCLLLKKISDQPEINSFYIVYALVANAASFGVGILIAKLIPGIF